MLVSQKYIQTIIVSSNRRNYYDNYYYLCNYSDYRIFAIY